MSNWGGLGEPCVWAPWLLAPLDEKNVSQEAGPCCEIPLGSEAGAWRFI